MSNKAYFDDYELNEADIDSALNWLRINRPDKANPENAIKLLRYMRSGAHELAHGATDDQLAELYNKFADEKLELTDDQAAS